MQSLSNYADIDVFLKASYAVTYNNYLGALENTSLDKLSRSSKLQQPAQDTVREHSNQVLRHFADFPSKCTFFRRSTLR